MDRQVVYIGQIPQDTDLLLTNKNVMIGLGYALQAVLGTGTLVDGLACTPTSPASLNVIVGGGSIYGLQAIDATAYGSLPADTTNQIVKQGIVIAAQTFSCPAPGTAGQSVVYLVEAAYQDTDGGSTVLPYYNASNPSQAWSGPNNTGVSQNTVRQGVCRVQVKTGVAATTGTQVTPAPDAGFTGLYAVTVANGQTTITGGNIQQLATAPFISTKLPGIIAAVQTGAATSALDSSGTPNTITIALSPPVAQLTDGMAVRVKVANTTTAAVVMNTNGLGNVSVVSPNGAALPPAALVANGEYGFTYDGNGTRWVYDGAGNLSGSLNQAPSGRLTLVSGTPVLTTPQSGAATVYFTPYLGAKVPLYNGTAFVLATFSELSQALSDATKSPAAAANNSLYDYFVWNDAGTLRCTRGPAWSSSSARGTGAGTSELQMINGIWTNKQAVTNGPAANRGTYVGTVATNGSATVDFILGSPAAAGGTPASIGLWNMYNRVQYSAQVQDNTSSWTNGSNLWSAANASNGNRVTYVCGQNEDLVDAVYTALCKPNASATNNHGAIGIGFDSATTAIIASAEIDNLSSITTADFAAQLTVPASAQSGLGQHFLQATEYGNPTQTPTFYGLGGHAGLQTMTLFVKGRY